jgi:hypothetical protein
VSSALVAAFIVIVLAGPGQDRGQTILQKQVRIEPLACHLPAVKAEYPVDGQWRPVTIKIRCAQ